MPEGTWGTLLIVIGAVFAGWIIVLLRKGTFKTPTVAVPTGWVKPTYTWVTTGNRLLYLAVILLFLIFLLLPEWSTGVIESSGVPWNWLLVAVTLGVILLAWSYRGTPWVALLLPLAIILTLKAWPEAKLLLNVPNLIDFNNLPFGLQ